MKKITLYRSIGALALAAALLGASAASAHDRDSDPGASGNGSCFRMYTHLFVPGFFGFRGASAAHARCWRPFWKHPAPSSSDTTAPVISGIDEDTDTHAITVTWTTNENANSVLYWDTESGVDVSDSGTHRVSSGAFVKDHKIKVSGLNDDTRYYFVIRSADQSGNASTSSEFSATTDNDASDTTAPTLSDVSITATESSVIIGWKTDEPADSRVWYDDSSPVDQSSDGSSVHSGTLRTSHSVTVPNLSANSKYYFVIQSTDGSGNTQTSPEFSVYTTGM